MFTIDIQRFLLNYIVFMIESIESSRVVLGSMSNSGSWGASTLTNDHQVGNPNEMATLKKEHPDELETVAFRHCLDGPLRVIGGLVPTRGKVYIV